MNRQNEITEGTRLLGEDGQVTNPGYCKRNLYAFDRDKVAHRWRLKEWDFYQVGNAEFMLQLCFANIALGAAGSVTLLDLKTGKIIASTALAIGTMKRYPMPANGDVPHNFVFRKGNFYMEYDVRENVRTLKFDCKAKGKPFKGEVVMDLLPGQESITIATPFALPGRFFLTQKLNCMKVKGYYEYDGTKTVLEKEDIFGVLDWGRGVWPHKNAWYWGNGSAIVDGKRFGFEITWGFGDESNATETALFYDGKCHKIGRVGLKHSPVGKWMEPWVFESEDNRFNLTMTPTFDHATGVKVLGLLGARCHQVHGLFNGTVVLDDGTVLTIKNMYAFCERMDNLW